MKHVAQIILKKDLQSMRQNIYSTHKIELTTVAAVELNQSRFDGGSVATGDSIVISLPLSANRKVAGSIPGLLPLLAQCGGVPEQDTT